MTSFTIWLILWVVTAPISYLLVRRDARKSDGKWTQIDRAYWVLISMLYGPFVLLVVILFGLALKIYNTDWARGEARW